MQVVQEEALSSYPQGIAVKLRTRTWRPTLGGLWNGLISGGRIMLPYTRAHRNVGTQLIFVRKARV